MSALPIVNDHLVRTVINDARFDYAYYTFMSLSGVLAAVAFLADSVPLLLGAMIVAPAYPPIAAISFALAGGYPRLAGRAAAGLLLGLVLAVAFAVFTTWVCNVGDLIAGEANLIARPLLEERVRTGWYSLLAALAAGVAGTIAIIKRKRDILIGIVASVALVPAAAAGGIALYAGDPGRAIGGALLLLMNVFVIISLGLLVLLLIRPMQTATEDHEEENELELEAKDKIEINLTRRS